MADSDNTTTLPPVTRRRLLAGTAAAEWQPSAFARNDLETDQSADPAVAVWRKGQAVHHKTGQLCRRQQRFERKLTETIGFPCATGGSAMVHSSRRFTKAGAEFPWPQIRSTLESKQTGPSNQRI